MDTFATKEELYSYLKQNKDILVAQKKSATKYADSCIFDCEIERKSDASKADDSSNDSVNLKVKSVINTTYLLDSHGDVHIDGLWNKSLKDRRKTYLLQEHSMTFKGVITDIVKPSVKMMNWSELGYNYTGQTQALIFDSEIEKSRNEYMYNQYKDGHVDNHSVGMQYVSISLAVNSTDTYYQEEKAVWDKYISNIANKKTAEEKGYFWAVTEARLIEGSAVPIGSNFVTPTLSVKEPTEVTQKEDSRESTTEMTKEEFKQIFRKQLTNTFRK